MRNDTKELAVQSWDDLCGSFAFLTTVRAMEHNFTIEIQIVPKECCLICFE